MKARVVEISGYVPAFMSLYMTGKNVDETRLDNIISVTECYTTPRGFVKIPPSLPPHPLNAFEKYLTKLLKYGIQNDFGSEGHGSLLDFIKISIFMKDLHRGGMDDYDAHAKRMDIIRSSTRANKKSSGGAALLSDWYKEKVMTFDEVAERSDFKLQNIFIDEDGFRWIKTPWGYVREDDRNNPDVLRGLVPLGLACDNISTVSFRNLRHIYRLRRLGTHASPELQNAMEQVRDDLKIKCPPLGDMLGKVWVPNSNDYIEETEVINARKAFSISYIEREVRSISEIYKMNLTNEQVLEIVKKFWNGGYYNKIIDDAIKGCIDEVISTKGEE